MPIPLTYPGVYVEEISSGVHTISGVSTAITAFVGRALKGPVAEPVLIHSFADFERQFGGLWNLSPMTFAVQQYFLNGGQDALIVRAYKSPTTAGANDKASFPISGGFNLEAANPGAWANNLIVVVDNNSQVPASLFNLTVLSGPVNDPKTVTLETLRNLSLDPAAPTFVTKVLEQQSDILRVSLLSLGTGQPVPNPYPVPLSAQGDDGLELAAADLIGTNSTLLNPQRTGVQALDTADLFNILCLPPAKPGDDDTTHFGDAAQYCENHRAMLLVDAPALSPAKVKTAVVGTSGMNLTSKNAAIFYPRIQFTNPLTKLIEPFVPCGAIAGIFARTDSARGVWKAPAGIEATITGAQALTVSLTDPENGDLNQVGINCLRTFPIVGTVVWGSRTMRGADSLADEWKYIPVRRTALFLEESLFRGLKWVVFEPNDEPLWSQIRLNVGSFLHDLFRQGAFQGKTPKEAYFVKCDKETTTQSDIDKGIVNILVGFAPLKPAEFVVIKIQQIAGQIEV